MTHAATNGADPPAGADDGPTDVPTDGPTDVPTDDDIVGVLTPLYAVSTALQRVVSSKPVVTRLSVLQAVNHGGPIRPSDVAEALRLHAPQVTRQIQALADEGLVEVSPDPDDQRARLVRLTDDGSAEVARLTAFGLTRWHLFVDDWDPAEVRELGRLLTKLFESMNAHRTGGSS